MKKNKVIGILLLILAACTVAGIIINKENYWSIYNYATIIFAALSGFALLKK